MIDPKKVDRLDLSSDNVLEEFVLFCIAVANKPAHITAYKVDALLNKIVMPFFPLASPFQKIKHLIKTDTLLQNLVFYNFGQYTRLEKAFKEIVKLNLRTCTLEELEMIPGIGPKTSRFFLLYTRPNLEIAVLDTHILKFLKESGIEGVPTATPQSKKQYTRLEKEFIKLAKFYNKSIKELDLEIWIRYNGK